MTMRYCETLLCITHVRPWCFAKCSFFLPTNPLIDHVKYAKDKRSAGGAKGCPAKTPLQDMIMLFHFPVDFCSHSLLTCSSLCWNSSARHMRERGVYGVERLLRMPRQYAQLYACQDSPYFAL